VSLITKTKLGLSTPRHAPSSAALPHSASSSRPSPTAPYSGSRRRDGGAHHVTTTPTPLGEGRRRPSHHDRELRHHRPELPTAMGRGYAAMPCLRYFRCMFLSGFSGCCICCNVHMRMLQAYVSSVSRVSDVCFIWMLHIHECCKRMFQVFHTYVASVSSGCCKTRSGCCICLQWLKCFLVFASVFKHML
jgi:hypothetical protein